MKCWTNIESFDRDMPIRFLPIKWEKLLLKLTLREEREWKMQSRLSFLIS